MVHAWGRRWDVAGSLGDACEFLFIGGYKDAHRITFPMLGRKSDIT